MQTGVGQRPREPTELVPQPRRGGHLESGLDPFKPYLCQRWHEGLTDATALHAELHERGYTGSVRTLRRYLAPFPARHRRTRSPAEYSLLARSAG